MLKQTKLKKYYSKCEHTINEYVELPPELVNMTEQEIKYRREWFKNLQRNFAHLLLRNLSPEEKHEKTVDQQLYHVCKTILKEEPLFSVSNKKDIMSNDEEYIKNEFKKNAMEFRKNSNWLNLLDRYDIKVING